MTKVKICGITNLEDALVSAKFGADALGFNFYPKSPRYISPKKAREVIEQLPPEVLKVGVFVNESLERVIEIAEIAKLDALQLHGEETPDFARQLKAKTNLEIIKAFRVSDDFKPEDVLQYEVDAVLLDAYSPKEHGGTGETFDWKIAKNVREVFPEMYLAGGLSQDNIARAISEVKPFAVDACSCLESEKGCKDEEKLFLFLLKAKEQKIFQIKNLEVGEVLNGKNWKIRFFDYNKPLEEIYVEESQNFEPDDLIVYSGIHVIDKSIINPFLAIKEAHSPEYGGDYLEFVDGTWRELGLVPNPDAPIGEEYFANPLEEDDSFFCEDEDYRKWHREGFKKYVSLY